MSPQQSVQTGGPTASQSRLPCRMATSASKSTVPTVAPNRLHLAGHWGLPQYLVLAQPCSVSSWPDRMSQGCQLDNRASQDNGSPPSSSPATTLQSLAKDRSVLATYCPRGLPQGCRCRQLLAAIRRASLSDRVRCATRRYRGVNARCPRTITRVASEQRNLRTLVLCAGRRCSRRRVALHRRSARRLNHLACGLRLVFVPRNRER